MGSPKWTLRVPGWMDERVARRMAQSGETKTQVVMRLLTAEFGGPPPEWVPSHGGGVSLPRPPELVERDAAIEAAEQRVAAATAPLEPEAPGCPHPKDALRQLGYMTRCGMCGVRVS